MALDRQSIEKRDFPIGRRGYDPDAVDAHLGLLADEVESLQRGSRGSAGVAGAAAEQVRLIVEAAEQSAADIERDADLESRRIRQDARDAAEKARSDAGTQARDHVTRVADASQSMLERLDAMEAELRTTLDGLRAGAARLASDLALLQGSVAEVRGATGVGFDPDPVEAPAPAAAGRPVAAPAEPEPEPVAGPAVATGPEPATAPEAEIEIEAEVVAAPGAAVTDEEGARLIALNMALNGSSRDEVEGYLAEHYRLADPAGLLDDVYARVG